MVSTKRVAIGALGRQKFEGFNRPFSESITYSKIMVVKLKWFCLSWLEKLRRDQEEKGKWVNFVGKSNKQPTLVELPLEHCVIRSSRDQICPSVRGQV